MNGSVDPCHCDRYGVVHHKTEFCDENYTGYDKPSAESIYGEDPFITAVNSMALQLDDMLQRIVKLENKLEGTYTKGCSCSCP
jgi:hypothetical protein